MTAQGCRLPIPQNLIISAGSEMSAALFDGGTGWNGTNATVSTDTTNYKRGTGSIGVETTSATNVWIQRSDLTWDLSASQGNLTLHIYIDGPNLPISVQLVLSSTTNLSKYFTVSLSGAGLHLGWNNWNIRTADWTNVNSETWANQIVFMRFACRTGEIGDAYSIDALYAGQTLQGVVAITLDDCLTSLYTEAYDYMKTFNLRGTSYLTTDQVGTSGNITWAQAQEMDADGWCMANHTKDHTDLTTLSQAEQEDELTDGQAAIEAYGMTRGSKHVAYPYGHYDATTLAAMVATGMLTGRTVKYRQFVMPLGLPDAHRINEQVIQADVSLETAKAYIDACLTRGEITVMMFHDLVESGATGTDWLISNFQSLIDYIVAQDIPVITIDDLYNLQFGPIVIPS